MLNAFDCWFHSCRNLIEAQGVVFEFYGETAQQTVKASNLNISYVQYEGTISVWETGDCNVDLANMGADVSEPLDECSSFVEFHFGAPAELDSALSSFCEMLVKLPNRHISVREALYSYWQSQPPSIHQ